MGHFYLVENDQYPNTPGTVPPASARACCRPHPRSALFLGCSFEEFGLEGEDEQKNTKPYYVFSFEAVQSMSMHWTSKNDETKNYFHNIQLR